MFTTQLTHTKEKLEYTLLTRLMMLSVALANGKTGEPAKQWEAIRKDLKNNRDIQEPDEQVTITPYCIVITGPKATLTVMLSWQPTPEQATQLETTCLTPQPA